MSTLLLMTAHLRHYPSQYKEEQKKDTGTCFNCKNQGEGLPICRKCTRNKFNKPEACDGDHFALS